VDRSNVSQAHFRQVRQVQPADRFRDVPERVRTGIAVLRRVRHLPYPNRVQNHNHRAMNAQCSVLNTQYSILNTQYKMSYALGCASR